MTCETKIFKDITSDCNMPTPGIEVEAWVFNRSEISTTYSSDNTNQITDISMIGGATAFKIKGYKKNLNCGSDVVVADDMPKRFNHYFSFKNFEFDTESLRNLDNLDDLCIVVERKDKPSDGDGIFVGYGFKSGLFVSSDTHRAWENNGVRSVEMTSIEGGYEPHSQYVVFVTDLTSPYAKTKAMLDALLPKPVGP